MASESCVDFDNYYLGGVLAEHLATTGHSAVYATPEPGAAWTIMTNELPFVYQALMRCNVEILTTMNLAAFDGTEATLITYIRETLGTFTWTPL